MNYKRLTINEKYLPVIGLEVHIELSTESKMFCSCSADYFTKVPNTHTCPVCLGLPGAMPTANKKAIEFAQLFGLALNCELSDFAKFDRKNYFYPDLAKGFQISQYDLPFSKKGFIEIETGSGKKKIGITRAHLEEDTGKLAHTKVNANKVTLIDFNRSGVPLLEIVTEPDMTSSQEAKAYAQKLQQIARYLNVSDADMEKGSMRIEPNVSLRQVRKVQEVREDLPPYKVELKNINSFKFAEKAIEYEIKRQSEILDNNQIPKQETRGWSQKEQKTVSQRSKEEAHDYRYFPEPDLPPLSFDSAYKQGLKVKLPELPQVKLERFTKQFGLSLYDAQILTRDSTLADYFEEAANAAKNHNLTPKQIANNIINKKPDIEKILPAEFVLQIYKMSQVSQISGSKLSEIINEVLAQNSKAIDDYKSGKENAIMFLIGQVMKKTAKKIDTEKVKKAIKKEIGK